MSQGIGRRPLAGSPLLALALCALMLGGCATQGTRSTAAPATQGTRSTAAPATQQLADADQYLDQHDYPRARVILEHLLASTAFDALPADSRYRALAKSSRLEVEHGDPKTAYGYLVRANAMPQADFDMRLLQIGLADRLGIDADAANGLMLLARRWPAQLAQVDPRLISDIARKAKSQRHAARLELLRALYLAHWKLKWGFEPSPEWRDLSLLLLEHAEQSLAAEVAVHVRDVYVLIAMRADRRFDAIIAANPKSFDIDAAAERAYLELQAAAERAPDSLELQNFLLGTLGYNRHYAAMLAAADSLLAEIESTNFPEKLYSDFAEQHNWLLDNRAAALQRAGRWDEALTELMAASALPEEGANNVSQWVNLANLYCNLQQPKEALAALDRVGPVSAYGAMQVAALRVDAAAELGDVKRVAATLKYMRARRLQGPGAYAYALLAANEPQRAATWLIERLDNPDLREDALQDIQTYEDPPGTAHAMQLRARGAALLARSDVQAEVDKVGRIQSYRIENEND